MCRNLVSILASSNATYEKTSSEPDGLTMGWTIWRMVHYAPYIYAQHTFGDSFVQVYCGIHIWIRACICSLHTAFYNCHRRRKEGSRTRNLDCEHHQLLANQFLNLSSNATESGTMAIFQILVYSIY